MCWQRRNPTTHVVGSTDHFKSATKPACWLAARQSSQKYIISLALYNEQHAYGPASTITGYIVTSGSGQRTILFHFGWEMRLEDYTINEYDDKLPLICHYLQHGKWMNTHFKISDELCVEIVENALRDEVGNVDDALACLYYLGRHEEAYEYIQKRLNDPGTKKYMRSSLLRGTWRFAYTHPEFFLIVLCHCFTSDDYERGISNEIVSEAFGSIVNIYPGMKHVGLFFLEKSYPFDTFFLERIQKALGK